MRISEVCERLEEIKSQHGDVEVEAFPGWDTSYPVTPATVEYYSSEVTGGEPHVLITGEPPERA